MNGNRKITIPRFRRVIVLCSVLLLGAGILHAQDARESFSRARLDLAVPDNPAYNILGLSQSDILRPAGVREIGVLLSSTIPGSVAFEAAPLLLFSSPTLQAYKANPFLYRIRISAATTAGPGGSRDLGAGIRFTIFDHGDVRTNPDILNLNRELGAMVNAMQARCLDDNPEWEALDDEERRPLIDACVQSKQLDSLREARREAIKELAWNQPLCEMGAALAAASPDSLYKHLVVGKYALWGTLALPFLDTQGQFLAGFRLETFRGDDQRMGEIRGTAALRAYYGMNDVKGFVNLDLRKESGVDLLYRALAGIELGLLNGFWIEASLGVERSATEAARISTGLDLRFGTPEIEN